MELRNIIPIAGFTISSVWQCEPRNGEKYDVTQLHARIWKGLYSDRMWSHVRLKLEMRPKHLILFIACIVILFNIGNTEKLTSFCTHRDTLKCNFCSKETTFTQAYLQWYILKAKLLKVKQMQHAKRQVCWYINFIKMRVLATLYVIQVSAFFEA